MPEPVLLAVDEEPDRLRAVEHQLLRRYADDYRVMCLGSVEKATRTLTRMSDAGEDVALVLVARKLSGGGLLDRVRQLHPHAKRVMLVRWRAWADPEAADAILRSMALGRIDYYVLRPGPGRDELFHQVVSSFLLDWARARRLGPHVVQVVGDRWARGSHVMSEVLQRNAVPSVFHATDSAEGRELLAQAGPGRELPLAIFPDGRVVDAPTGRELAEAFGVAVDPGGDEFDVVVIGAGPAGLSAAVYGASEGLRTLVLEGRAVGGQAGSSSLIRNFLGFPHGVSGADLAGQAYQQAWVFGARFAFTCRGAGIERVADRLAVELSSGKVVTAESVVLATGATYRRLGVPALEELNGAGVYYGAATAEAQTMAGGDVYVVGGANSAGQTALHLARHARSVTLLVRGGALSAGMSEYLIRALDATPNVEVRLRTTVIGGGGEGRLQELVVHDAARDAQETVPAAGLFILIGARPRTDWLPDAVARDESGFVLTGRDVEADQGLWPLERRPLPLETSLPGLFAAGDVRHGSVKRVASAVGEGSIAIQLAQRRANELRLGVS